MMPVVLLLATLLLTACYNPDYAAAHYKCTGPGQCPDGLDCIQGTCQPPGDARPQASPDLRGPGPIADMSLPIAGIDCPKGSGTAVGPQGKEGDIYACKGNFNKGDYLSLCPNGYHPCTDIDATVLKTLNRDRCQAAGGFYTVNIDSGFRPQIADGHLACLPAPFVPSPSALAGCGNEDSISQLTATDCLSLLSAFPCDKQGSWNCNGDSKLSGASHMNKDPAQEGGVLCCK